MEYYPAHRKEQTEEDKLAEAISYMRDRLKPTVYFSCGSLEQSAAGKDEVAEIYIIVCTAYGGKIATQALTEYKGPPSVIIN